MLIFQICTEKSSWFRCQTSLTLTISDFIADGTVREISYFKTVPGGGHSGTEGGRTRVTYFAEEGVFACPRFCKRSVLFYTQVRSTGGGGGDENHLQSTKYTRL